MGVKEPTLASSLPTRALVHVPAVVALGLAALYAIGAIAKVAQIYGAGFSPSVVVQDTPIQQLLALGVNAVVEPVSIAGLVALTAIIAICAWMIGRPVNNRPSFSAERACCGGQRGAN